MPVSSCHLCTSTGLRKIIDLGFHPLADSFLKKEQLEEPEEHYPLTVLLCMSCGHAMNSYVVPPEKRYQEHDYSYDSSNSKVSIRHFADMARDVTARVGLKKGELVVDIGSSVGTLLSAFKQESDVEIVGIEPAPNIADIAEKKGIPTIRDFWGPRAAESVLAHGKAKLITSTNAFNHVSNLDDFMHAVVEALGASGSLVIEVPYLLPLVEKLAFDTMYLEHVSYFAVKPLVLFFKKFGMIITDVEENEYMGGSLRLSVSLKGAESQRLRACIAKEEAAHLYDPATYEKFSKKIREFKYALVKQLLDARLSGGIVIGIGAPAKGNTLLNYCGIDASILDFITDASPLKINKYTPGTHIPIVPDEAITSSVTHALILPWNIADFLKEKLAPKYPLLAFIIPHAVE